jgi:hypothetical protein
MSVQRLPSLASGLPLRFIPKRSLCTGLICGQKKKKKKNLKKSNTNTNVNAIELHHHWALFMNHLESWEETELLELASTLFLNYWVYLNTELLMLRLSPPQESHMNHGK